MESSEGDRESARTQTMMIKSMSIRSFKSFDGKMFVSPLTSFSCIVGPNGTGKSVIGEALAFVLGASPRALRVNTFSSLISRNSGANSAKVSVVLQNNIDDVAVKISRVLCGSATKFFIREGGDTSKREISLCNLRQKLAYYGIHSNHLDRFIVMQNRVTGKLKQPRDLLKHLELVIGTSHFEEEIAAVEQQIERHSNELDCLQQNLWEIELKRKQLSPEVEKWTRFTEKWEQFCERRTIFLRRQQETWKSQLKSLKDQKREKTNMLIQIQNNLAISQESWKKFNQEHTEICMALNNCHKENRVAEKERELLRIKMIKEEVCLKEIEDEVAQLKQRQENEEKSVFEHEVEAKRNLELIAREIDELQTKKELIIKEKEDLENKRMQMLTAGTTNSLVDVTILQEEAFLTSKLRRLKERFNLLTDQKRNQLGQASEITAEIETLNASLEERAKIEEGQKMEFIATEARFYKLQEEANKIREEKLPRIKEQIHKNEVEMKHLLKKLHDTQNREGKISKEEEAAHALSQMFKDKLHGRVMDLFIVNNQLAKAVNSILCHLSNPATTFVVDDRDVANEIVLYFREKRIGIVTCEILSELSTRFRRKDVYETGPYVKPVLHDLQYQQKFQPVLLKYFGSWCVAKDLCAATAHFKRKQGYSEAYNVVTENGDIFKKDGEVIAANWSSRVKVALKTGGNVGKVDEAKVLLMLKETIDQKALQRKELESNLFEHLNQLEQLDSQRLEASSQLQTLQKFANVRSDSDSLAVVNKLEDQQTKLNTLKRIIEDDKETGKLKIEIQDVEEKRKELRKKHGADESLAPCDSELFATSEKIKHLDENLQSSIRLLQDKKSSCKKIKNQLQVLKSNGKYKSLLVEKSTNLATLKETFIHTKEQLQALEVKSSREKEVEQLEAKKSQLENSISGCKKQEKALRVKENSTRMELSDLEASESVTNDQLRKVVTTLQDTSESPLHKKPCLEQMDHSYKAFEALDEDEEGVLLVQEELSLIEAKRKIHADALEEDVIYRKEESNLNSELARLNEQVEAQRNQKEKLENDRFLIFTQTAKKLNDKLSNVYQQLTKHGDVYLSFTEDKKLLFSSGVNIQVRPDRYKWRAFTSLSGGQQALVSLSLSFSLQKLFSSPFYFFDEIDASLDTKNARLIAEYIKNQSSSQYIVVSHRPNVYELASSLIGVYHYKGASTCVTVLV